MNLWLCGSFFALQEIEGDTDEDESRKGEERMKGRRADTEELGGNHRRQAELN